ncbi:uncharacterized protein Bfra_010758 [Botrytis fragariae]|uniref:Uncharacterized protein n=1 Tax=Botrytis fragariae TaxID=1964551 RepID=A0A8H6EEN8_9HELO|nr:uncharacterized protein Bfra_010758 [Botrytis fragariae]KAF5869564.1 hypothetical protein Bfra_010758 [Botrytis fragariae]
MGEECKSCLFRYSIKEISLNVTLDLPILAQEEPQLEVLSRANSASLPHSILLPITSIVQRGKAFDQSEALSQFNQKLQ